MNKNKYLSLCYIFFKVGLFTFGGGLAMLPIITKEVVDKMKWVTDDEMADIVAISEATPGPIAVNAATFIGYKIGGLLGAILSTLSLVFPSFVIISLISLFFDKFIELEYVKYAFMGIRCAVAILIVNASIRLFIKTKKTYLSYILMAIALAMTFVFPSLSSIYLILGGAIVGLCETLIRTSLKKKKETKE